MACKSTAVRSATRVAPTRRLGMVTGALVALMAGAALLPAAHAQQTQKKSAPLRGIFTTPDASPSQPLLRGTLPGPSTASSAARSQLVDEVVAVVNTDIITRRELLDRADLVERTLQSQNRQVPARPDLLGEVLEQLILERVQAQTAKESGIRVSDADVDRAVESVAQRNNLSVSQLKAKLAQSGLAYDKYREDLRQEILLARLRDREVDSKVQVFDGEIDNFLAQQGGSAASGGAQEYNVAQILVPVAEDASAEQKAAARGKAESLLKQVQGGADFAKLARDSSGAPEAAQGGELGLRPIGRLPAQFANAVVDLKPGQVVDQVIESPAGFHVLKLVDKRAPGTAVTAKVAQTQVRHILIKTGPTMSADDARRQLAGLRDRIVHGYDFGDAARRYSQDNSASAGGELGWVSPGQLVPEFEQAMGLLKPGEVSQPVQSQFGLHLIQVEGRREAEVPVDRQRDYARSVIREQKVQAAYEDWLRQLRDSAHVEYRVNRQQ
ncbi:peptidylprolyl isomerase [Ralstonia pseudosolanacearum]|uniref:Chaperone SurA n=1 Tax=Ralstonia solanacearum TaxID=305 RepID=A0AA92Q7C8_RALSL|nr:peptidylprolyl isomerase [Ralstonia pseudosolanacearum]QOK92777.1 molecular chaperone SurA [Ralstonia pseudosolanacearum]QOK97672.1 molecular chaperone SurA [Ralstonia pseudosolanacearum]UWD90472.1 peptidylprolyl isomerase [Ralstonia pseudosolanacearum]